MTATRLALLLSALAIGQEPVLAQDIAKMQAEVDAQLAAIATLKSRLSERSQTTKALEGQLDRLRAATETLEKRQAKALEAMNAQYQRIVDDPALDLSTTQAVYRDARETLGRHQDAIAAKQREIEQAKQQIAQTQREAQAADRTLAESRVDFDKARAQRLHRELNVEGEIKLSNAITCERNETIAACMQRGERAAAGEATKRFKDRLFAAATEAEMVARHRAEVDAEPRLVESSVVESGFRGQGDFFVELRAQLRSEISQPQACRLLGLPPARCGGSASATAGGSPPADEPVLTGPATAEEDDDAAPAADGNYRLTVRSNVYYDEVYINGVAYGSTKLDVMLPAGEYDLEIRKPGHTSYKERIKLDRTRTVKADLAELGSQ